MYELQEAAAALRTAAIDTKRIADAARDELIAAFALEESQVLYDVIIRKNLVRSIICTVRSYLFAEQPID